MEGPDYELHLVATSIALDGTSYIGRIMGIQTTLMVRHPRGLDEFYLVLDMGTGPTHLNWDDIRFAKSASMSRWKQVADRITHQMFEQADEDFEMKFSDTLVEIAKHQARTMGWEIRS